MHDALIQAVTILLVVVLVVPLFRRARISPVIGYLFAGLALRSFGLGDDPEQAHSLDNLAHLGVVFLMFTIGLELSLDKMAQARKLVFGLGTAQVLLCGFALGGLAWWWGARTEAAIVVGGALALSSTAMVLQTLIENDALSSRAGQGSFYVLLFQDLAVVPLLVLMPLLGRGGGANEIAMAMGLAALKAGGALLVIILLGRYVLKPFFRHAVAGRASELFVASCLAVVLGIGLLTEELELSMALGAFLAGLMLAETEFRHQIEADIHPFKGLLLALFFVTVGLKIDLMLLYDKLALVIGLLCILVAIKASIIGALAWLFGKPRGIAIQIGLTLAQGGEFALVLFGLAAEHSLLNPAQGSVLSAVVVLSMTVTPLLMLLGRYLSKRLSGPRSDSPAAIARETGDLEDHVIIAGFGRCGQVVSRMLEQFHVPHVAIDREPTRVVVGRRSGAQVMFGDSARPEIMHACGIERARGVIVTLDEPNAGEALVRRLRHDHPDLLLVARARDTAHAQRLEEAGATTAVPELIEGSMHLGAAMLRRVGHSIEEVEAMLDTHRRDDYARLLAALETPK